MKTSRVKAYYQDYLRAVRKYGCRSLNDCYKNPSLAKAEAEREIFYLMHIRGGYGYSVIRYNIQRFNCGYLFQRDDELWFAVHTSSGYGEMKVEED